jgi:hypothetical protein
MFFFEQTTQASTCQTVQRPRGYAGSGATPYEVSHIAGAFQAFLAGCQPDKSALKILKENFKMSIETILIIVVVVFLLGGGGWYWGRGRS